MDIEFRGKRVDNGEWVYGDICQAENDMGVITKAYIAYDADFTCGKAYGSIYLMTDRYFEVDPKTTGQDTGLKDKNGKKIFEGDKVRCYDDNGNGQAEIFIEFGWSPSMYELLQFTTLEVIGTIHDCKEEPK